MSRFAAIVMFLAWLLYGAMPAVATPLIPVSAVQAAPIEHDHSQHRGPGQHDHGKTAETAKAVHAHGDTQQPCPHGGKTCVMPFCAACLTLLPAIIIRDDSRFVHAYPVPAIEQALVSPAPAPLTPPPRA